MSEQPMIEIVGLRERFNEKKQKNELATWFFNKKVRAKSVAEILANPDKFVSQFPEEERYNLFYTTGNFHDSDRARQDFAFQDILPIDIDGIDLGKLNTYIDVVCASLNIEASKTGIVASGNGLHFLIQLEERIPSKEYVKENRKYYKEICSIINNAMESKNLSGNADPTVFDYRRILRLPNTLNKKPNKPEKKCRVIQPTIEAQGFKLQSFEPVQTITTSTSNAVKYASAVDSVAIQNECEFVKWCKENQNLVNEPQWFAMVNIIGRLPDGKTLVHEYSKDHYEYTYADTNEKIDHILSADGPRLCESVSMLSDTCNNCKHNGKIRTPLQIKGPEFIKTKDTYFHEMFLTKEGVLKVGKPNFTDLYKQWKKEFKHITIRDTVYIYKETHWVQMEKNYILAWAKEKFDVHSSVAKVKEFYDGHILLGNIKDPDFFARKNAKMNCKNGVYDFQTKEVSKHSPKYGFTYCLEYDYDPTAECPVFDDVMQKVTLKRQELVDVMLEFFGYSFSNMRMKWHKCLVLKGYGQNGKSTVLQIIKKLAGIKNGCSTLNLADINLERNRVQLIGKLFNVAEETPKRSLMDSSGFKSLVGGEAYIARALYSQPIEVEENRTKLIMAANEMPMNDDTTAGLHRRLLIVPFDWTIPTKTADYDIHEKLEEELSGILNRVIEGYDRLIKQGNFTDSETLRQQSEEYFNDTNPVAAFISESITQAQGEFLSSKTIYAEYEKFMQENHASQSRILAKNVFFKSFNRTCKDAIKTTNSQLNQRGYKHITLKSSAERDY